jgi:hypothetical protein
MNNTVLPSVVSTHFPIQRLLFVVIGQQQKEQQMVNHL